MKADYHTHSIFSSDGRDPPHILCEYALEQGFTEIAITDHAEWHDGGAGFPFAEDYFAAIAACREYYEPLGLTIYTGVELGNPHDYPAETARLLNQYPFDITIGSLHWLYGENIHLEQCFARRNPYEVYADYFTELARLSATANFHIVGHFDRILWRGTLLGTTFDPFKLETIIRMTLSIIAKRGQILELNARLLAHHPGWTHALITMLGWYKEMGGWRVVINSDAHRADQLDVNRSLAQAILCAAGFDEPLRLSPLRYVNTAVPVYRTHSWELSG